MLTNEVFGRRGLVALVACLGLGSAGCGDRFYPVRGTILLHDGTPLAKGLVIFERIEGGPPASARGNLQADGRFELSTARPGDGVPLGRYRMVLNPLDGSDVPDEEKVLPFDVKYVNFATSDLVFEVKAESNDFQIKLAPAIPRQRR
jgi:hypothetical protein